MKKNFEDMITELEDIVKKLESGEQTLEESLELFEKGIKMTKECQGILDNAEKKVSVLMANESGEMEIKKFDTDERA